jgi:predicted metal-dependent HD superfamily phosphohydrolase
MYNPGRKKVLTHFLKMDNIYKTNEFSDRYEQNAKTNMQAELNSLTDGTI